MTHYYTALSISATLLCSLLSGCSSDKVSSETSSLQEEIIGHWGLRDIDNGVQYDVYFRPDSSMHQRFHRPDGYERTYSGTYVLFGDTLQVDERRDVSTLVVSALNDSVMILVRPDSTVAVFDRLPE